MMSWRTCSITRGRCIAMIQRASMWARALATSAAVAAPSSVSDTPPKSRRWVMPPISVGASAVSPVSASSIFSSSLPQSSAIVVLLGLALGFPVGGFRTVERPISRLLWDDGDVRRAIDLGERYHSFVERGERRGQGRDPQPIGNGRARGADVFVLAVGQDRGEHARRVVGDRLGRAGGELRGRARLGDHGGPVGDGARLGRLVALPGQFARLAVGPGPRQSRAVADTTLEGLDDQGLVVLERRDLVPRQAQRL